MGIIGAMRQGLAILPETDPGKGDLRYFGVTKHNLTPGGTPTLCYRIVGYPTTVGGEEQDVSMVAWLGTDPRSLNEINAAQQASASGAAEAVNKTAVSKCYAAAEKYLADGEWHRSTEVLAWLLAQGHSERVWERCRKSWSNSGRLERRMRPAAKQADGTKLDPYWELRLVPGGRVGGDDD